MKNVIRIYKRDVKNILTNWVALVVTVALIILPSLYGWFNIKSSWDPYGNTQGIKVAVVNEDEGGTFADKEYKLGEQIIDSLKDNDKIGWQFVNAEEADKGVRNGEYYASITIPSDFSTKILSITSDNITEATLQYTVNEKTNAIAPKITDKGVTSIKDQVSSEVVKTVDGIILKVIDKVGIEIRDAKPKITNLVDLVFKVNDQMPELEKLIDEAYDGTIKINELMEKTQELMPTVTDTINTSQDVLNKSNTYLNKADEGFKQLAPIVKQDLLLVGETVETINNLLQSIDENTSPEVIKSVISKVQEKVGALDSSIDSLINVLNSVNKILHKQEITDAINSLQQVKDTLGKVTGLLNSIVDNSGNISTQKLKELKDMVGRVNGVINNINANYDTTILPAINSTIQELEKITNNASYLLDEANKSLPDVNNILNLITKGSNLGQKELAEIKEKLPEVKEKLNTYVTKLKELDDEAKIDEILDLIINDWQTGSTFLSSPIQIEENKLYPIPNYGSAMSPFFTTLSLWVGALLLVSLFTTHARKLDDDTDIKPLEEYFGKYLTFITIAIFQGIVATVGDIFILKAYVLHPVLFVLIGILISIVFMTMIYTLVSVFGNVGKAIAVIFLVLQISASGGTFPVEVMPNFFQKIHPLLPFKYGIGAMREAVAGILPELLQKDIILLLVYFVIFMGMGIVLKAFVNKHAKKFIEKLNESGILGH